MTHDQTVVQIGRRRPARESNQRQNAVPLAPSPVSPTCPCLKRAGKPFASVCWWSSSHSAVVASCWVAPLAGCRHRLRHG